MSQRKPPEFVTYRAELFGYTRTKPPGTLKAGVEYQARDIDAAVELLVEKHLEFSRMEAAPGLFWHQKNGNPDVFFKVQMID